MFWYSNTLLTLSCLNLPPGFVTKKSYFSWSSSNFPRNSLFELAGILSVNGKSSVPDISCSYLARSCYFVSAVNKKAGECWPWPRQQVTGSVFAYCKYIFFSHSAIDSFTQKLDKLYPCISLFIRKSRLIEKVISSHGVFFIGLWSWTLLCPRSSKEGLWVVQLAAASEILKYLRKMCQIFFLKFLCENQTKFVYRVKVIIEASAGIINKLVMNQWL